MKLKNHIAYSIIVFMLCGCQNRSSVTKMYNVFDVDSLSACQFLELVNDNAKNNKWDSKAIVKFTIKYKIYRTRINRGFVGIDYYNKKTLLKDVKYWLDSFNCLNEKL